MEFNDEDRKNIYDDLDQLLDDSDKESNKMPSGLKMNALDLGKVSQ